MHYKIDVEQELISILSEELSKSIDKEIFNNILYKIDTQQIDALIRDLTIDSVLNNTIYSNLDILNIFLNNYERKYSQKNITDILEYIKLKRGS